MTRSRRKRSVLDIDEHGRVRGFVAPPKKPPVPIEDSGERAPALEGPLDPILDLDHERILRGIADTVLMPVEIIVDAIAKLKGLPRAALVGFVLYEMTKREGRRRG